MSNGHLQYIFLLRVFKLYLFVIIQHYNKIDNGTYIKIIAEHIKSYRQYNDLLLVFH